jgi:hypothetical protein
MYEFTKLIFKTIDLGIDDNSMNEHLYTSIN